MIKILIDSNEFEKIKYRVNSNFNNESERYKNLKGLRVNKLVVKELLPFRFTDGCLIWLCLCDCGKLKEFKGASLTGKYAVKSCGCYRSGGKTLNLKDKTFGYLTVIEKTNKRRNTCIVWNCLCVCGNYKEVESRDLVGGNIKSCGCKHGEGISIGNRAKDRVLAAFKTLYNDIKSSAKGRKIGFLLSFDEVYNLCNQNCYYCNSNLSNCSKKGEINKFAKCTIYYNGIDRINSELDYTLNNCVPCCYFCNRAKFIGSQEEFYSHAKRLCFNLIKNGIITKAELMENLGIIL